MPATKDDLLSVLRNPRISNIDFHVGHCHVSGTGYELVAAAIEDGRISVETGESSEWAAYGVGTNTFFVRRSQSFRLSDQALVVHECTHALLDIRNAWKFTDLSSEAAAYLAQVVFLYLNKADMTVPRNISTPFLHIYRYACTLVERYKPHRPEGRGSRLEWEDYKTLRRLIQRIPEYKGIGWLESCGVDGV